MPLRRQSRRPTSPARGPGLGVQREVASLPDRAEAEPIRMPAESLWRDSVLDLEHRLAGAGERFVAGRWVVGALGVLEALLVDREIESRLELLHLAEIVLQADREAVLVRDPSQRPVEDELRVRPNAPAGHSL